MRFKLAALSISVAACALVLWPPRVPRNDLRITFIDVGQADAILIQTPRGHAIMIDTGGRLERNESGDGASAAESVGEKIVVPFLIRQGIHHVDAILLTHPHGDHKDFHAHKASAHFRQDCEQSRFADGHLRHLSCGPSTACDDADAVHDFGPGDIGDVKPFTKITSQR